MQKSQPQDGALTKSLTVMPKILKIPGTKKERQGQEELLFALQKVSEVLTSEVDLEKILTDIATIVGSALGARWVNFWELTPDKKAVQIMAAYGMESEYMEHSRKEPIPLGKAWIGRAVKTGRAWSTSDILRDPKVLRELGPKWEEAIKKQDYRALLCIPLFSGKTTIGGMCLYYPNVHRFTDFEMRLMTIVGNQAATAIANTKFLNELTNERTATLNILEDVEENRKRAEEEKNKTLAVFTYFSDGLIVFDEDNKIILFNPQAETLFHVKSEKVVNKTLLKLSELPNLTPLVNLLGKDIRGIFRKELKINDNSILEISTLPMISGTEKFGTLVVLHDITREKTIERIKTEFVSVAAHQLRTPLSAIKWTLKMLLDGDLGEVNKEQRSFIERTYQSNERMIGLINDLLDVSRIEEGRYLYKPSLTRMENIVQFVINSFQEQIQRKNLQLEFRKLRSELPEIEVDVEKLRLVIQNLLDNAIKYTPLGGRITISLDHDKIKREMEFKIQDSGVGIPLDQQERVFAKFFRGSNVTRMETEGSGLGLFITKNIIEAHGGKIWFESKEGEGTTFYFILPIKKEFERFIEGF